MNTLKFNPPLISTELCEIMGKNKSDKGHKNISTSWHNYTMYYFTIFNEYKNNPLRIFELGLGTNNVNIKSHMGADGRPGASLYGWLEFFKNAEVYGADIDKDILFNTDKIKTFYCDQTNPTDIQNMWKEPALNNSFNIIIEDGLHEYDANVTFFENSIHKLAKHGYFIIEDIITADIHRFQKKIEEWVIQYPHLVFTMVMLEHYNTFDNNLLVIKDNGI